MYHDDVCTAFDDQILDLIDYAYRSLTEIIRKLKQEYERTSSDLFDRRTFIFSEQRSRHPDRHTNENPSNDTSEGMKVGSVHADPWSLSRNRFPGTPRSRGDAPIRHGHENVEHRSIHLRLFTEVRFLHSPRSYGALLD